MLGGANFLFQLSELFVVEHRSILRGPVEDDYSEGSILPIKLFCKILFFSFLIDYLIDVNLVSRVIFFVLLLEFIEELVHVG